MVAHGMHAKWIFAACLYVFNNSLTVTVIVHSKIRQLDIHPHHKRVLRVRSARVLARGEPHVGKFRLSNRAAHGLAGQGVKA